MARRATEWTERTTDYPLGKIVKEGRARLGLTQMEFADRVGISQAYVSSMERGTVRMPEVGIRRRLAGVLGMSHVELLIGSGELDAEEVSTAPGRPLVSPLQRKIDALDPDSRRAIERIVDDVYDSRKRY